MTSVVLSDFKIVNNFKSQVSGALINILLICIIVIALLAVLFLEGLFTLRFHKFADLTLSNDPLYGFPKFRVLLYQCCNIGLNFGLDILPACYLFF